MELVSKSYNFFCWFFQFSTFREFCRFEYICTHQLNSTLYLEVQVQSTRHFHRQRIQRPNSKVICLYTVHCTLYSQSANTTWTDLNRDDTTPLSSNLEEISTKPQPWKNVCAAITQNCDWLESWNSVTKTNLYNNFFYEFWQKYKNKCTNIRIRTPWKKI